MPYTSPTGGTSPTIPNFQRTQTQSQPASTRPSAIPIPSPAEDSVKIRQSPAESTSKTAASQGTPATQEIKKTTEAAEKTATAKKAATNVTPQNKTFYQAIIDFFQQLGEKIMNLFTPTSKEAIEKALIQAELKADLQAGRINRNTALLQQESLTTAQKAALEQDTQKAEKKLKTLTSKHEKLGNKLKKLEGHLTNTEIKSASPNTEIADETGKKAPVAKVKTTQQATSETSQKIARETAEEINPANAIGEFLEELLKDPEGALKKAESLYPEAEQAFLNFIKKLKP